MNKKALETDIKRIANGLVHGLTATWRTALREGFVKSEKTARKMAEAGLIAEFSSWSGYGWVRIDEYTPLGLAVRTYLQERKP